ncbi:unnamed protein product [Blepharisma stoltei]|uniref:MORN repeat protein n=1 Tax=Blepharisma stoltei TaxID=1481888 RepID=A0AAU9IMH4_9CILI|nr:unnamed protein product [Blepharisma stoltei]
MTESQEIELSGHGEFDYMNGDVYVGQWEIIDKAKKRHGHGKFLHALNPQNEESKLTEEYEGQWENDQMHGYGVYKYISGAIYEGDWFQGKQHGHGTYQFPNGAKYVGQWENHRMHGEGIYTDPYGVDWKGIFVNGTYDSTVQKRLKAEYEEERKVFALKKIGSGLIAEFKKAFSGEKKTWKEQFTKNLVGIPEDVDKFVAEPYSRWEERTGDKWNDLLNQLLEVEPHVLKSKEETRVLSDQRVFANQLQGPGQVLEFKRQIDNRKIELCAVLSESGKWVIFHSLDVVEKK